MSAVTRQLHPQCTTCVAKVLHQCIPWDALDQACIYEARASPRNPASMRSHQNRSRVVLILCASTSVATPYASNFSLEQLLPSTQVSGAGKGNGLGHGGRW